jgi:hypothetical protein
VSASKLIVTKTNGRGSVVRKAESWKGAAVQRGLEYGRKEIAVVRSCYQETSSENTAGWKRRSMCCSDL